MVGYAVGPRPGALIYNLAHNWATGVAVLVLVAAIAAAAMRFRVAPLAGAAAILLLPSAGGVVDTGISITFEGPISTLPSRDGLMASTPSLERPK